MIQKLSQAVARAFKAVGRGIAIVVSLLFYFLILAPFAIVLQVAVGDPMRQRIDPGQPSYWRRLNPTRPRPGRPF